MSESDKNGDVFGRRLRETRQRRRLKQETLAKKAQVPTSSISHFEHGKHKPSYDSLYRLAHVLDVSVDYLMGRTDYTRVLTIFKHGPPQLLTEEQVKDMEAAIDYAKTLGRYSEDWAPVVRDDEPE